MTTLQILGLRVLDIVNGGLDPYTCAYIIGRDAVVVSHAFFHSLSTDSKGPLCKDGIASVRIQGLGLYQPRPPKNSLSINCLHPCYLGVMVGHCYGCLRGLGRSDSGSL